MSFSRSTCRDLARFVPVQVLRQAAEDPQPLTQPRLERGSAAVLFIDISGFTLLSEGLTSRGARGIEELTGILNGCFGRLIEGIEAHGGDVVKFAGDALLALWPVKSDVGEARVIASAARCALRARDALRNFPLGDGRTLSLRIGLGAGEMVEATIGGVRERWEFVAYGPASNEATAAAGAGAPGEVMVGPAARVWLPADWLEPPGESGFARLHAASDSPDAPAPSEIELPDEAAARLLSYLPAAIHTRLQAGQSSWLGEWRHLTVLFVNLPNLNVATPLEKVQAAMQLLQTGLYHYEGSVNKLSIDDKGVMLVAALGLPPLAHENDPALGVRAALEMHERLAAFGWRSSIGVTSGRAFCGAIGSERRCEYTIIGDVVNLAARLMQAAGDGILCDTATHDGTRERLEFETLAPIKVKGKTQPVPISRPIRKAAAGAHPGQALPMIGRTEEAARIAAGLADLAAGAAGGVAVIEGEAGIGKSRFVARILEQAAALHLDTLHGNADALECSTPYFAWRPVFRKLLGLDQDSASRGAVEKIVAGQLASDPSLARLAPLLSGVLGETIADNEFTANLSLEARVSSTTHLLLRLLEKAAHDRPRLLILEDGHWLDSASWALAHLAARSLRALALVLVTRPLPEPFPREYSRLLAKPDTIRLVLQPLSADEDAALVSQRLGVRSLPPAAAEWISAKSQGNPFYSEELALALRESGTLQIENGECRVADGHSLGAASFPETVQGVVTSRIDRLGPSAQLTLKVASVIGRTFRSRIVRDVFPLQGETSNHQLHLDAFVQLNLTRVAAPPPDLTHAFRHVITQEVAYQLMPPTQRRSLHRAVAEWHEMAFSENLSTYYPLLARHWSEAGDVPKAIEYLEKAGDDALRQFANEEAVSFLQQALALDAHKPGFVDPMRRARWYRQLGEAVYGLSDLPRSLEYFCEGLKRLGHPLPSGASASVAACIVELVRQMAHRILPAALLRRTGESAERALEAARAYERVAQVMYMNNAKAPTIHAAIKALNLAETLAPGPELARSYGNATVLFGVMTLHRTARANARRAHVAAAKASQPACTAYVDFVCSVYWASACEWDRAEAELQTAIRLANEIGEPRRWLESAATLINVHLRRGDLPLTARAAADLTAESKRRGLVQGMIWGIAFQLWAVQLMKDAPAEEAPYRAELAALLLEHPELPLADHLYAEGILAWSHWRRGERSEALRAAARAEEIIVRTGQIAHYLLPPFASLAQLAIARVSEASDDPAVRRDALASAEIICGALGEFRMMHPCGAPVWALHAGRLHHVNGRVAKAHRIWRRGLRAAERQAMRLDEGLLHFELACHLPESDPARALHWQRAKERFKSSGAGVAAVES